jgi:hypothetical protein
MRTAERRNNLAGVKVGEADDRHFREPEFILNRWRRASDDRLVNAAAQHWRQTPLFVYLRFTKPVIVKPWQ